MRSISSGRSDQLTQVSTNLTTNQSYLTQTDSTLSSVANLLTNAQSTASSAAGTTISASQQQQAANQIGQLVQQLVACRPTPTSTAAILFAGSEAGTQPFVMDGKYVEYVGNAAFAVELFRCESTLSDERQRRRGVRSAFDQRARNGQSDADRHRRDAACRSERRAGRRPGKHRRFPTARIRASSI